MLPEMMKFSFQHRAFYCYLVMSLWIFFLVTAMYRYMGSSDSVTMKPAALVQYNFKNDAKLRRIISNHCNPPEEISIGSEGMPEESVWALQGVLVLIRHGDRGPLNHVRAGNTLNCMAAQTSEIFERYKEYMLNTSESGKATWLQSPGPFHGLPLLPSGASCHLGQLTSSGVDQVLKTGSILKLAYGSRLQWSAESVLSYSTRYRRTFQSALALLWSVLPPRAFLRAASALRESHSVAFCFRECSCPAAEAFLKKIGAEAKKRIDSHPAIVELVKKMSKIVFQTQTQGEAEVLKDALLAYLCHASDSSSLPCIHPPSHIAHEMVRRGLNPELDYIDNNVDAIAGISRRARNAIEKSRPLDFDTEMEKEKLHYYRQKFTDNLDPDYEDALIVRRNIDGDFNFNADTESVKLDESLDGESDGDAEEVSRDFHEESACLNKEHVASLFAFLHWNVRQNLKSTNIKKKGILNAYGLIHNIVQNMLKIISEDVLKLVLYSGHDKTIQALILALGLSDFNHYEVHYSSRVAFEVYRRIERDANLNIKPEATAQDYFFRLVLNGADVTNQLVFCRNGRSVVQNASFRYERVKTKSNRYYLCAMENIVRFIHDDYFAPFNATNYKDACTVH